MEIATQLLPAFQLLQGYGFHLRKSEGSVKKHVRYDDFKKCLFLQYKVGNKQGSERMNIYAEEAHELLRDNDRRSVRTRSWGSPLRIHQSKYGERTAMRRRGLQYRVIWTWVRILRLYLLRNNGNHRQEREDYSKKKALNTNRC